VEKMLNKGTFVIKRKELAEGSCSSIQTLKNFEKRIGVACPEEIGIDSNTLFREG
jgi:hypothetical protein